MILPAATLAALFFQCAPDVAPDTLLAIIRTESGGNPYIVNNITDKEVKSFDSLEQAASYGNELLKKGANFSAGLMQIYSGNFSSLDINDAAHIFEPCNNIKAGATILTKNYISLKKGDEQEKLRKALSMYYSGNTKTGFKKEGKTSYVERVENHAFAVPSLKPSLNSPPINKEFQSWDLFKDFSYETIASE